jgi:hypothetical protein
MTQAQQWLDGMASTLEYLSDRWSDERGHEDIQEYAKAIERPVDGFPGASVEKMTKRPFGCVVRIGGGRYRVSVTRRSLDMVEVG